MPFAKVGTMFTEDEIEEFKEETHQSLGDKIRSAWYRGDAMPEEIIKIAKEHYLEVFDRAHQPGSVTLVTPYGITNLIRKLRNALKEA